MANPKFIKEGRKLATIREIVSILPIEGADKIETVVVDGWECVVKKDEKFKVGDKIVYIEIDSIVPERPEFEFLRERKFRVRTIKLRKQISQGLVLSTSILPKGNYKLGDDVTETLGIKKYDPEAEIERVVKLPKPKSFIGKFLMRFEWYRNWLKRKYKPQGFPNWFSKTDETRVQNLVKMFNEESEKGTLFFETEKLDGQSFSGYIDDRNKQGICSRNLSVPINGDSNYAIVYRKYDLEKVLKELKSSFKAKRLVIQGEICGPGIQGNKYKLSELKLFIFNIRVDGKLLTYYEMRNAIRSFDKLELVPLLNADFKLPTTVKEMVEHSKGISTLLPTQKREGIVVRDKNYIVSFKTINPEFLLEED
jgi:hypothetical protein